MRSQDLEIASTGLSSRCRTEKVTIPRIVLTMLVAMLAAFGFDQVGSIQEFSSPEALGLAYFGTSCGFTFLFYLIWRK